MLSTYSPARLSTVICRLVQKSFNEHAQERGHLLVSSFALAWLTREDLAPRDLMKESGSHRACFATQQSAARQALRRSQRANETREPLPTPVSGKGGAMRILVVEDEFTARSLLLEYTRSYGTHDVAVSGEEAVHAVKTALERRQTPTGSSFSTCFFPNKLGPDVLKEVRKLEEEREGGTREGSHCEFLRLAQRKESCGGSYR